MKLKKKESLATFCKANKKFLTYLSIIKILILILIYRRGCSKITKLKMCEDLVYSNKEHEMKRMSAMIEHLIKINRKLSEENKNLMGKFDVFGNIIHEPSSKYEYHRRKLRSTIIYLWDYLDSQINFLSNKDVIKDEQFFEKLKLSIYEYKIFLLNEWNEMSRNDGYDYWRLLETAELNKLMQNRFDFLQSSMNCEIAKVLKCSVLSVNCDWGCQMSHLTECLTTAYATHRILIYNSTGHEYKNLYQPLSKSCLEINANNTEQEYWFGTSNGRIVKLSDPNQIAPNQLKIEAKSILRSVPADLVPRLEKLVDDPQAWWLGMIKKYQFRLVPEILESIDNIVMQFMFKRSIVGIFMAQESTSNFRKCMKGVQEYYDILEVSGKNKTKRIFLAGESSKFLKIQHRLYPEFEVITMNDFSDLIKNLRYRYSKPPLLQTIIETHLMLECDFVCSPFETNTERIVYELMSAQYIDAFKKMKSSDKTYFVDNEIPTIFREINGKQDEIFLESFHILVNGSFTVLSNETEEYRVVPAFKLEKVVEKGDFPSYSSVSL